MDALKAPEESNAAVEPPPVPVYASPIMIRNQIKHRWLSLHKASLKERYSESWRSKGCSEFVALPMNDPELDTIEKYIEQGTQKVRGPNGRWHR